MTVQEVVTDAPSSVKKMIGKNQKLLNIIIFRRRISLLSHTRWMCGTRGRGSKILLIRCLLISVRIGIRYLL